MPQIGAFDLGQDSRNWGFRVGAKFQKLGHYFLIFQGQILRNKKIGAELGHNCENCKSWGIRVGAKEKKVGAQKKLVGEKKNTLAEPMPASSWMMNSVDFKVVSGKITFCKSACVLFS